MEARKKRSTKLLAWLAAIAVVFAMTLPSSVVWADETVGDNSTSNATGTVVAKIGEKTYTSLQKAVDEASDGATIELLSNVIVSKADATDNTGAINITRNLTINGKGHTIEAKSDEDFENIKVINIMGGATVTLNDLTIDGKNKAKHGVQAYTSPTATGSQTNIILNNVTIKNNLGYGVLANASAIEATNLKTEGNSWGGVNVDSQTANASFVMNSGTIAEEGSVIIESATGGKTSTVINGGSFKNIGTHPNEGEAYGNDIIQVKNATITGKVSVDNTGSAVVETSIVDSVEGSVTVINSKVGEQENVTQVPDNVAAIADGIAYTTLQEAVTAGGKVTLLKNVTEDIIIETGKTVILDLNGYKLTNSSTHTIINKGYVTIRDSSEGKTGTIDNITHAKAALYNDVDGTAILDGGTFVRSEENGITASNNGGNSYYAVLNHGTMTINEGVRVVQKGQYSSLLENGWQSGSEKPSDKENSVLIINGGTFSGGLNTIKNDDYGELTIHDGLFENFSQAAFLNWNVAVVNGGTFDATGATHAVILNGKSNNTMDKGELTINGGNFDGGSKAMLQMMSSQYKFGNIKIKGGNFSGDKGIVGTVKDGDSIELSGGVYTVQPAQEYIAAEKIAIGYTKAGEKKYYIGTEEEIKEIVNKADSGDTITVLQGDLTLTNVPAGVTVANAGDGTVTVNGTSIESGKEITVPKPAPPVVKADYSKVDAAIEKANALTASNYKDFSAVEAAIKAVVRDKNSSAQAEVDAMAKAIEDAIGALQYKDADYTAVDAALEKAAALNKEDYKDFSAVEAAIAAVVRDKNITQQAEVDAMAKAIEDAIAALEAAPKPEPEPAETVTKADIAAGTMALNKKIKATWSSSNLAVTWGKVSKADGYEVYAAKCGNSYTKVKTVKGSETLKYTVKKINGKKLNTKTTYKVRVKAYRLIDGKKKYTGTSYGMHTVGLKNKTYTNAKSVKASKKSVTLKKGKTRKASVKITKQTSKKKLLKSSHVANLRYFSTNTKVAAVTKAGTIKAAGKGTCTVYALAANGVKTTVKVTVK